MFKNKNTKYLLRSFFRKFIFVNIKIVKDARKNVIYAAFVYKFDFSWISKILKSKF